MSTNDTQYIKYAPALIVEVVSESSQTHDYVHKFLDYTQIPSLRYYLIVEPETLLITVYEKTGEEWTARKYTRIEDLNLLPFIRYTAANSRSVRPLIYCAAILVT